LIAEAASTKERLFLSAVWLFSTKGYEKVGIRELCRSLGIKESAFYNHFTGKDALLGEIFEYYRSSSEKTALGDNDIEEAIATGDVATFFAFIMSKFAAITDHPVFRCIRRIVVMESITNPEAGELAMRNLYLVRREFTERALTALSARGLIRACDVASVTAEYYYGLQGILDEYLLSEAWGMDGADSRRRIGEHIDFFSRMLESNEGVTR
jgi:TetR/AcrR family transcriptional regulator, biofilm operon repressor